MTKLLQRKQVYNSRWKTFHTTLKARKGWGGCALRPPKLGGKDLLSANLNKKTCGRRTKDKKREKAWSLAVSPPKGQTNLISKSLVPAWPLPSFQKLLWAARGVRRSREAQACSLAALAAQHSLRSPGFRAAADLATTASPAFSTLQIANLLEPVKWLRKK